ncbi:hypothetical protein P168DRAFT_302712 [Aspergillus campestris IBT 28561]|uniref:GST N-terminal domain-containing protein n=1 Tax=Aspergillus campestris (strain IBT 28561) TaxID=1392248 RepID=A0A2I1D8Z7_ASPC2|nr:uncharacterized protein P168DRAFT_302712 [Aspergillus campestris IBT 28561]PKY06351.1 hypothetical protein P168DRAFT_302712 [Aspergillus campestris IBT 28561]
MTAPTTTPNLTLYDIAFKPPVESTTCAPNPWKSRYALNFKSIPYKTVWVPLPDIASVRRSLNVPASRNFADGKDFHTLPVLTDASIKDCAPIGDSFDIAIHLQTHYPDAGPSDNTANNNLFPADTPLDFSYSTGQEFYAPLSKRSESDPVLAAYARFNTHVDAAFSAHVQLAIHGMPLDPATAEETKAEFLRRAGMDDWEALGVKGEARRPLMESFRGALEGLAKLWGENDGPFVRGEEACYADFIVGGWLRMMGGMLPGDEWEEVKGWFGGFLGGWMGRWAVWGGCLIYLLWGGDGEWKGRWNGGMDCG